jgi:GT2 family glycosyltransferase
MIPHHIMRGEPVENQEKPLPVSFVEGTCPIYRVEALRKILPGHIFYPSGFFQYLEDNLNGLLLWNSGYRCITLPRVVARHKREAGGGGILRTYCLWRNRTALVRLTDSRFKIFEYVFGFSSMIYLLVSKQGGKAKVLVKGIYDGHGLAKKMRKEYGFKISLDKVPMYRLGFEYLKQLLAKSKGRGRLDEMDL